jgi:hypothetical protein
VNCRELPGRGPARAELLPKVASIEPFRVQLQLSCNLNPKEMQVTSPLFRPSLVSLFAFLAATTSVRAGDFGDAEIEPRFRAKIVKQKIKMKANEVNSFKFNQGGGSASDAECGTQNIGNVDTGGKIGRGPREVFVFAPNAINLVSGRGCQ